MIFIAGRLFFALIFLEVTDQIYKIAKDGKAQAKEEADAMKVYLEDLLMDGFYKITHTRLYPGQ